jgi:ankyrin repeat protein
MNVSEDDLLNALHEVSIRVSDQVLGALSQTPLWDSINDAARYPTWWFERTEYLVGRNLKYREGDWKTVYNSLLIGGLKFSEMQDYTLLLVQVLFEIGADPTLDYYDLMRGLAKTGTEEAIRLVFSDTRVDVTAENNMGIYAACQYGNTKMVKILLSYPEVNLVVEDPLEQAVENGYLDIVQLMLADNRLKNANVTRYFILAVQEEQTDVALFLLSLDRVDPSTQNNLSIRRAAANGDAKLVSVLLSDTRVDPTSHDEQALRRAVEMGYSDVVYLLLADGRSNPRNVGEEFEKAVRANRIDVVHLLLSDGRLDPSHTTAIGEVSKIGTVEMLKVLMSDDRIRADQYRNYALRMARKFNRRDIEAQLLTDKRVRDLDEKEKKRLERNK